MHIDVRIPVGGLFSILGLVLIGYGLMTYGSPIYVRSLGININLWWGLVMLVFGGLMFFYGVRPKSLPPPPKR